MELFFEKIFKILMSNGYAPSKAIEDHKDEPLLSFMRSHKGNWYVFIIINMELVPMQQFKIANLTYSSYYSGLTKRNGNVYIVNLLVTTNENSLVKAFIDNLEPFEPVELNNIFWGVQLDSKKLIQNKNNPTELLNIKNLINQALGKEKETYIETLPPLKTPHLTLIIIALNITYFILISLNGGTGNSQNLVRFGAIHPVYIRLHGEHFRLLTATFIHSGIFHLGSNMPILYAFGKRIESLTGLSIFATIYTVSAISASLFSLFLSNTISVGASGAVSGLLGSILFLTYKLKRDIYELDQRMLIMFTAVNVITGFSIPFIDAWAHLGGFIGGVLSTFLLMRNINEDR
ncbi:MAG: rhomboid family intramembrane serine protease [Defluviitaleaceae bacterium]|nr:rhomboid family intramembrane serine protease [Defluviitaleaceae bacterium]